MTQNTYGHFATASELTLQRLSLRANFSWTLLGNLVYASCQWGMLVVLAKLGSPVMVGQFALGLAVTAPVYMFANLQLRAVQATDALGEYDFGHYFGIRLITTALALLFIAGIVIAAGYRTETVVVILAVALAKGFESISDIFYGLLQQKERMDRIAKSMMIKGPFSLAGLALGVYLTGNVVWGVIGLAVVWLGILLSYDAASCTLTLSHGMPQVSSIRPRWEPRRLSKLACLAFPLGVVMMFISLDTNVPRYFIEHYLGERELGIFAAMAYFMVAGSSVVNALGQSASPRLAILYSMGRIGDFRALLLRLVGIGALIGISGIFLALLAGREVLTVVYRPEYARYNGTFILLMVGAGIGYASSFLGYAMTVARKFSVQAPLSGAVVISSVLSCLFLVRHFGLAGAAVAVVISSLINLMASTAINVYFFRSSDKRRK